MNRILNLAGRFEFRHRAVRASTAIRVRWCSFVVTLACWLCLLPALPYPPAPHHLIYGSVRDEMGNPLVVTNAEVILETLAGIQLKTKVYPNLAPGLNYKLAVPMDAGLTSDSYKPTALRPTVPFRMKVKIGPVIYMPIQMTASYAHLGKPAQSTRLDLTLGEDADGDGLPDAWERALLAAVGALNLQDINPNDDADGDGLSNLHEYIAGTYAFDPEDGFELSIAGFNGPNPFLEFLAIRGHTYSFQSSTDLRQWLPLEFRLATDGPETAHRSTYQATDSRLVRVEVLPLVGHEESRLFFKAQVH